MIEFSYQRARRLTLIVGAVGAVLAFLWSGFREGAGFAVGAAISLLSFHSWARLSEALSGTRSVGLSALFMALRYIVIGVVVYAIVKVLGSSPVAMITGLLASFAAVILEILYELIWKNTS